MHDRPICFTCHEVIEHSMVFEAPCGHEECPSACYHGVCLMEWREYREESFKRFQKWLEEHRRKYHPDSEEAPNE